MNGKLIPSDGLPAIPMIKEKIVVGRQPDCDICIPFPNVSSRHAEFRFHQGWWILLDRKSSNGTSVNGDKIERKRLKPGDEITFARKHTFKIDYKPESSAPKEEVDVIIKKKSQKEEMDTFSQSLLERAGLSRKDANDDIDPSMFFDDDPREEKRHDLLDE
ncbi:FHA domain-containing protein [bacterium]|jgi:pSer/pThr/pTyr-binding forkhead associated (FHA) protein|nr:FHA domain-containing protein [bacterium]